MANAPESLTVVAAAEPASRRRLWTETAILLALFPGAALLQSVILAAHAIVNQPYTGRPITDFAGHEALATTFSIVGFVIETAPAWLAMYLLRASGLSLRRLGIDGRDKGGDILLLASVVVLGFLVNAALSAWITGWGVNWRPGGNNANLANPIVVIVAALRSGIVEETVLLGYLLTRLEQLGVPRWLAGTSSVILRTAYHIQDGPFTLIPLVYGAIVTALYLSSRRLLPIIGAHVIYDAAQGLLGA